MMKRRSYIYVALVSLVWLTCGMSASSQNFIGMDSEINVLQLGDTLSIPVSLTNADEVVAVQMNISTPSGVSIVKNEKGDWIELSERAGNHALECYQSWNSTLSQYVYKVVVYSINNSSLKFQYNAKQSFAANTRVL